MKNADKPAHPLTEESTDRIDQGINIYTGLTKREYFAAMAMQGMLACPLQPMKDFYETISFDAVKMADEILKQLEK